MKRKLNLRRIVLVTVVLALALAAGTSVTLAAPGDQLDDGQRGTGGPRPQPTLMGVVWAIGESSLTIETRDGELVTVNVTEETKICLVVSQSEGTLGDIEPGDFVEVQGPPAGEGTVEARVIVVLPPDDQVRGQVTAIDGNTITLEDRGAEVTVITDGSTEFRAGREAATLGDVQVGQGLTAFGQLQNDGSLLAELVVLRAEEPVGPGGPSGPGRPGGPGPRQPLQGEVTAIDDSSLTIETRDGEEVTVDVTEETKVCLAEGRGEGTLGDIEPGDFVQVHLLPNDDGTLEARSIVVLPNDPPCCP